MNSIKIKVVRKPTVKRTLIAVLFENGIYRELNEKIYRNNLDEVPSKSCAFTGYDSLISLLIEKSEAVAIFEGDKVEIGF